jgi:hypothetical protein
LLQIAMGSANAALSPNAILEAGPGHAGARRVARRFGEFAVLEPRLERFLRSPINLDCVG